jgi:hypothetical protein
MVENALSSFKTGSFGEDRRFFHWTIRKSSCRIDVRVLNLVGFGIIRNDDGGTMRDRLRVAARVGLVVAAVIAVGHPVFGFPQDERATQRIADMSVSHIRATKGRIADDQLDKVVNDYIGELLKAVPALSEQYKDAAALNGLVAKVKAKLNALNIASIGPSVPPAPKPEQPQKPPEAPDKPAGQPQQLQNAQNSPADSNGPYFKDHPDWLEDAKKLLSNADRALASVLIKDSATDQAFKLKAEKRVEELKNWVQHEGRFANDPYFLDTFLQRKLGKKVSKLGEEDMKALDQAIREITRSTDGNVPAGTAGTSGAGTGGGAASSSVVETLVTNPSARPAGDEVILVRSPAFPRLFQGLFTHVRTISPSPLTRERYIIVDP